MPSAIEPPTRRLGLAVIVAAVVAAAAALAFDTFERESPPTLASGAPHPPRVLDRVLVRPPVEAHGEPGVGADIAQAPSGDATALPRPAVPHGGAVVMAPPEPPASPPVPAPAAPGPRQVASRTGGASDGPTVPDAAPARHLNREGIELINAGRPGQAIARLERAASLQPRDAEILGNLGYAYMLVGEHGTARRHLARALDLAPTRSATWLNLGQTYAELGERERAVDAVVTGYRHSTRKASVHAALLAAATGTRHSPRWREAAGLALARIGDG